MHSTRFLKCALAFPLLAHAVYGRQAERLLATDGSSGDAFGRAVAVAEGMAAIGAPNHDGERGAVYVFDLDTRRQIALLQPDELLEEGRSFGHDVAISSDYIAAGSRSSQSQPPAVYVFDRDTMQPIHSIRWTLLGPFVDDFGQSIALNEDGLLALGDRSVDTGAIHVFDASSGAMARAWGYPGGGGEGFRFGWSVDISRGITSLGALLVGAPFDNRDGSQSGSAFLFIPETGDLLREIAPADGEGDNHDWFGFSVALAGRSIVVGAPRADDLGGESGKAYVFDGSSGEQLDVLLPEDGAAEDEFGISVAIAKNRVSSAQPGSAALIGAPGAGDHGAAYLFDLETGEQIAKLVAEDIGGGGIGEAVALDSKHAVAGAERDDIQGAGSGSVYLFDAANSKIPNQLAKIEWTADAGGEFGGGVALSEEYLAIGDPMFHGAVEDDWWRGDGLVAVYANKPPYSLLASRQGSDVEASSIGIDSQGLVWNRSGATYSDLDGASDGGLEFGHTSGVSFGVAGPIPDLPPAVALDDQVFFVTLPGVRVTPYGRGTVSGSSQTIERPEIRDRRGLLDFRFGRALAVSEDYVAVGGEGVAYVYSRPELSLLHRWEPEIDSGADFFGAAVALEGGDVFVGAPFRPQTDPVSGERTSTAGAVYRFNATTGNQLQEFIASDRESGDYFGWSLAVSGDRLLVGAPGNDDFGEDSGAAYVFDLKTAEETDLIRPEDGGVDARFGAAVAMSETRALIGAPGDDQGGSAYLFSLPSDREDTYAAWAASAGLEGADAEPGADPNGDGVPNGAAFVYGAESPTDDAAGLVPVAGYDADSGEFVFSYRRADRASDFRVTPQFSFNLDEWFPAINGLIDGRVSVSFETIEDGYEIGVAEVRAVVEASESERLFVRLLVAP